MEKQWHNMTVAERKEVIKESKKERSPVERCVIKPCPFCGSVAELIDFENEEHSAKKGYKILCLDCLAQRSNLRDKDKLIAAWNRRAI